MRLPSIAEHGTENGLGQQECTGQVGAQHVVPVGPFHAQHQAVTRDAGVIDQDLDLAELFEDRFCPGLDRILAGHIEGEHGSLAAASLDFGRGFGEFGLVTRRKRHGRSCPGQFQCAGLADSL